MIPQSPMPVEAMPEAATPAVAVPGQAMPVAALPVRTMSVGEVTPAEEETQRLGVIRLELRHLASLDRIAMPVQPTDISVGMTTTTTLPTEAMPDITGPMCLHVPVLWRADSGHASSRRTMRATTSTGSTIKMSWTSRVRQDRHVLVHGS